jgi:hypothetical protein
MLLHAAIPFLFSYRKRCAILDLQCNVCSILRLCKAAVSGPEEDYYGMDDSGPTMETSDDASQTDSSNEVSEVASEKQKSDDVITSNTSEKTNG